MVVGCSERGGGDAPAAAMAGCSGGPKREAIPVAMPPPTMKRTDTRRGVLEGQMAFFPDVVDDVDDLAMEPGMTGSEIFHPLDGLSH